MGTALLVAAVVGSGIAAATPAVTLGRTLSDTFAGIAPASAPAFILAQAVGGGLAVACAVALYPDLTGAADDVVVPHAHHDKEQEPS